MRLVGGGLQIITGRKKKDIQGQVHGSPRNKKVKIIVTSSHSVVNLCYITELSIGSMHNY